MQPEISRNSDAAPRLFRVIPSEMEGEFSELGAVPDEVNIGGGGGVHSVRDRSESASSRIPALRNGVAGDLNGIPVTYLNRINSELHSGQFDIRIVLSECRGLKVGSRKFSIRYIEARLKVLTKQKIPSRHPLLAFPAGTPACAHAVGQKPTTANSFCIRNLPDLFLHFRIWLLALLMLELWNSWKLAHILDDYLLGGVWRLGVAVFSGFVMLDAILWFRCRNGRTSKFILLGGALVILLLIVAMGLYFFEALPIAIRKFDNFWSEFEKF